MIIGAVSIGIFKINPGVDFTSGTRIEVVADQSLTEEEVESEFETLGYEISSVNLSGENNEIGVVRFDTVLDEGEEHSLKQHFEEVYGHEPGVSVVSPIVGQELVKNAVYAVAIASLFIVAYIAVRFEIFFGVTAVIALLHDVFFMLVAFSITQIEFDITIVAAILTIIGYSLNNTLVIFDRIRENIRHEKRVKSFKKLAEIINKSIIQSFTRTMNTSITTIIAVVAFLVLGASSIWAFAFALLVGLLAGTYTSLFLASQLWLVWRGRTVKDKPVDFRKKEKVDGLQV